MRLVSQIILFVSLILMMNVISTPIGGKWIWRELGMNNRSRTWIRKWNPIWNIRLGLEQSSMNLARLRETLPVRDLSSTILNGLCSFMLEDWRSPIDVEITRAIENSDSIQTDSTRRKLARESGWFNLERCPILWNCFQVRCETINLLIMDHLSYI